MNALSLLEPRFRILLGLAILMAALPLVIDNAFYLRIAALVYIFALATLGLNLLMGFAGLVSLGHAGFVGIGAYTMAVGPTHLGWSSWTALVAGPAIAGALAWLVGRPILKLRGHYFAVATLGLGLLISMVLNNETAWTGGPDGMTVPRLSAFGWTLRGAMPWYWTSAGVLLIGAWVATNLIGSPTGRALRAIHDSDTAAGVLGVNVAQYKLAVFVLSAVFAAIAGAMLALFHGHITPESAGFMRSVEFATMAVLGGLGSILGSVVGTAILVILPQALVVFHEYEHVLLGLLMMVFMIFLRAGIVPSVMTRLGRSEL